MTKNELLKAAEVIDRKAYLLFPSDIRLTFYAQQVRALALTEALRAEGCLAAVSNIAVVGGGASGMTAAAALKVADLSDDLTVTLFENRDQLLPLQAGCHDKLLAPHLIDWPLAGAAAEHADLPLLDWRKAAAITVAADLDAQFARFNVNVRCGRKILSIQESGHAVELRVEGELAPQRFDLVIIAAGFGLESHPPGVAARTNSYWRVNPAQQPALAPIGRRQILISGLGDGGLIDFVLFACPGLPHQTLCTALTEMPDARNLASEIDELENRIWADPASVPDIAAAYLALDIDPLARRLVVPQLVRDTAFTLITLEPQLFHRGVAPLNRLAAALVIRAAELDDRGTTIERFVNASLGADDGDQTTFTHDGNVIKRVFDEVVIRHGDSSNEAWDFDNAAISGKVNALRIERKAIATRPVTPTLSSEDRLAIEARTLAALPTRIRLGTDGGHAVRWQADLPPDLIGRLWHAPTAKIHIDIDFPPSGDHSRLDLALCRLLVHAEPQGRLTGNHRQAWIDLMNEVPRRAGDATRPAVEHAGLVASHREEIRFDADQLGESLEASLDDGLLTLLDIRMAALQAGTAVCPVSMHASISAGVFALWPAWLASLRALSTEQRRWVLRLFGGLLDDYGRPDIWSGVRVGPKCVDGELLHAILYHLALQSLLGFGSSAMSPKGNVVRAAAGANAIDPAHFCGTRWIATGDGPQSIEDWDPKWAGPQFLPSCLILPTRQGGFLPQRSMTRLVEDDRMLKPVWSLPPIIHNSTELRQALRAGRAEAIAFLNAALRRPLPEVIE